MERTLVLGGSGFLGAHTVAAALRAGHSVVSASREPGAGSSVGVPSDRGTLEARPLDLLKQGALEELFAEVAPARVILCSALSRAADCERYPVLARQLNVAVPERLARLCAARGGGRGARLVHVSTDLVFGRSAPPPEGFDEDAPPGPLGVYGETKAAGEAALLEACPGALVVRLPLLWGDSGGRGLGASDALFAALDLGQRPGLFTDEWRTPLAVEVAARALVELAESPDSIGRLHVAGPERLTRHALGLRFLVHAGRASSLDEARELVTSTTRAEAGMAERAGDVALDARRARVLVATELPGPP